jgi:enamine deaminase RidA (YjgF/YER057c/UK114 family)
VEEKKMTKRELINPPGTEKTYQRFQFSQAVRAGNFLFVSGQVGRASDGHIPDDIEGQTRVALENLKRVIEHAGGTLEDVVEINTFHTDMNELAGMMKVKSEFFPQDYPAWTAIGCTALAAPQFKLEVKAVAVID